MKPPLFTKLLISTFLISSFCSMPHASAQTTIKFANAISKDSHYGKAIEVFDNELNKRFNKKFTIEHFSNSALGGEREVLEGLQLGSIDASILSTGAVYNFIPEVGVFDIPFLFKDLKHARNTLDGDIGQNMLDLFPKQDLIALAWAEQGFRHLTNNKRPVITPKDAQGLKIRTTENKVHIAAFKQLGVLATPMAWPEVFPALQQGTIDGQENPISVLVTSKLADMQKYLSLTAHVYSPAVIIFSPNFFNNLSKTEQQEFKEISLLASQATRDFVENIEKDEIKTLKKEGMQVNDDVDTQAFSEQVEKIYSQYYKQFGKDLINKIKTQQ